EFIGIKNKFSKLSDEVGKSKSKGKEKHPVLGFLSAKEWLQAVEMHFRHHIQQKERIDIFLKGHFSK
ncbi:MAG TPA: hypothetical protein VNX68_17140, partial [Nitrosopumilaceae archaeon]|nr:hypothetical protein [Nitrosopumilaceae archaeon]